MLIVATPDAVDVDRLREGLQRASERLSLEAVSLSEVGDLHESAEATPSHVVSVYGVDHPGIVHAVTSALAAQQVNITDLTTRLVTRDAPKPLYAMVLEVSLPEGRSAEEVERALSAAREEQEVEVSIRPLEQDSL
jgi:predicted amino acid-binding ACT domain protein